MDLSYLPFYCRYAGQQAVNRYQRLFLLDHAPRLECPVAQPLLAAGLVDPWHPPTIGGCDTSILTQLMIDCKKWLIDVNSGQ